MCLTPRLWIQIFVYGINIAPIRMPIFSLRLLSGNSNRECGNSKQRIKMTMMPRLMESLKYFGVIADTLSLKAFDQRRWRNL